MDFDWLTIHVDKINTPQEWAGLVFIIVIIAGVVWYLISRNRDEANARLDTKTITAYQNNNKALEERIKLVEDETKDCQAKHSESLELIHNLQGELKAYKDLALIPKDFIKEMQRNQLEIIKLLKKNGVK